jgi:hypothetical protein
MVKLIELIISHLAIRTLRIKMKNLGGGIILSKGYRNCSGKKERYE